ncbi:tubby-like F-box protein 6 [Physcomitrium patens]|uniref:Tubby-like F-box protein n=2 Tax=Physcomitrium patens TaxID=3218 RepID=A0A7I4CFR4_PHYPA|nr:tubby-like F-box protein 6 [Physcomitrium patens]|eukprot:XP_024362543.1 tubby-like F-box protein 6 [Physcomitrella patens]
MVANGCLTARGLRGWLRVWVILVKRALEGIWCEVRWSGRRLRRWSMSGQRGGGSSMMPLKSLIREFQEMKGGIGNISRRSFELKFPHHHKGRSSGMVLDESQLRAEPVVEQSCWANMPPELLRDVIQRVEASENAWPSRKHVVACAAVCSSWREITKELVRTPEQSGRLTFPIALKQPGPRDSTMQCFIKRDRTTSTYQLFLGLPPSLVENGKFLLAARKCRRATSTDYIVSLNHEDMSRGSNTYVGKLRSNFLGTKFTIYDSQPPHSGVVASNRGTRRLGSKQLTSRVHCGSHNVAHIAYELNVLGTRGPRRMQCTMHSIPASAMASGGSAPTPTEFTSCGLEEAHVPYSSILLSPRSKAAVVDSSALESSELVSGVLCKEEPLVLKNKAPRWHEQLQCWCLNFRGRVTVASVKNFQLVAATTSSTTTSTTAGEAAAATGGGGGAGAATPAPTSSGSDHDKVLLQFGKIGKDMFTMDYRYPLSAFQAFAICLSSFDTKLACE